MDQLKQALFRQAESRGRRKLGEILVAEGFLSGVDLARALAKQNGVTLDQSDVLETVVRPVVNEQSLDAQKAARLAISSTVTKRPRGIFDNMKSMCSCVIWSKIAVFAAAGVMQLTDMSCAASSLPSDFVSAITPAFEAEYAGAFGLPSLPAIEATLTMRP